MSPAKGAQKRMVHSSGYAPPIPASNEVSEYLVLALQLIKTVGKMGSPSHADEPALLYGYM